MPRWRSGAAVLVFCAAALSLSPVRADAPDPAAGVRAKVGRPVPEVTLRSLDGADVRLSELRGDGVLLIQFFASWCGACREEVETLNRIHEALGGQGLAVIGIDYREDRAGVEAFVGALGNDPPAYPLYLDPLREAERAFQVVGVPLAVLVDREGVIAYYDYRLPAEPVDSLARFLATGRLEAPTGVAAGLASTFRRLVEARSVWAVPVAFVGGMLSVLLPCVYPVIPVAVSFFAAQAGGSRGRSFLLALAYALGIAVLVALLGLTALLLKKSVGEMSANPVVNVLVGLVIVFLALATAGVVHGRMPAALGRLQGRLAGMKGMPAAFLLGAVSGPVVSVCVAPILGSILLVMRGEVAFGTLLLFLYGFGLGAPFVLLGTFTGLIKSLPRPGRWMRVVQVGFGVLLAVAGLYFLVVRGLMEM